MQVALFCALLAVVATPPKADEFTRLGRARADFGDKHTAGKWKFVQSGGFGGTEILFPVGRSDRRYYFTDLCGSGYRLCCESKHGRGITLDWMIHLDGTKTRPAFSNGGTLWKYLSDASGLPAHLPEAAREALQSKEALAGYRFGGVNDGPYCWFLFPDGKATEPEAFDVSESDVPPRTRAPYTVTNAERTAIRAIRARKPTRRDPAP